MDEKRLERLEYLQSQVQNTARMVAGYRFQESLEPDSLIQDPIQQYFAGKENIVNAKNFDSDSILINENLRRLLQGQPVDSKYQYLDDNFPKVKSNLVTLEFKSVSQKFRTINNKIRISENENARVNRGMNHFICRSLFYDEAIQILQGVSSPRFTIDYPAHSQISQIVILGSGFDTRTYRCDYMKDVKVFEVDMPELQQLKTKILEVARAQVDKNSSSQNGFQYPLKCKDIARVSCDLLEKKWIQKLVDQGYDKNEPTYWLAEGLFMYLSETGFHNVFKDISANTKSGSYFGVEILSASFINTVRSVYSTAKPYLNSFGWGPDVTHSENNEEKVCYWENFFKGLGWHFLDQVDFYEICQLYSIQGYDIEKHYYVKKNQGTFNIIYKSNDESQSK